MTAATPFVDIDDVRAVEAADEQRGLWSVAMAGAQIRAVAEAVSEGALAALADLPARSVVLVADGGRAGEAFAAAAALLTPLVPIPLVLADTTPNWVGALDVVVVAGDDPSAVAVVNAASTALRRSAEVVLAVPEHGPLLTAGAGRALRLPPRVVVPPAFTFARYYAIALAVVAALDSVRRVAERIGSLTSLADRVDAELEADNVRQEIFHNPAKAVATRMSGHRVVFAGVDAATTALARHAAYLSALLAGHAAAAMRVQDALECLPALSGPVEPDLDPMFHDPQIDGPRAHPVRVLCLSATDNPEVRHGVGAHREIELVAVDDPSLPAAVGLAVLAARLESAAVYLQVMSAGVPTNGAAI